MCIARFTSSLPNRSNTEPLPPWSAILAEAPTHHSNYFFFLSKPVQLDPRIIFPNLLATIFLSSYADLSFHKHVCVEQKQ
jgi:hypothetical protein